MAVQLSQPVTFDGQFGSRTASVSMKKYESQYLGAFWIACTVPIWQRFLLIQALTKRSPKGINTAPDLEMT